MSLRKTESNGSNESNKSRRGQSSIIGVAVLAAVTVLSIAALATTAGTFVADGVAAANSQRVAEDLVDVGDAGERMTRIEFSRGTLHVEPRTVRIIRNGETVTTVDVDALVYENRGERVAALNGALVDGRAGQATVRDPLPVVAGDERLLVDVVALNATGSTAVGGSDPVAVTVRTDTTHEYREMESSQYAVAIETTTPEAWERAFAEAGLEHARRDFDGDGVPSVVASSSGEQSLDLAIHDLRAVIRRG